MTTSRFKTAGVEWELQPEKYNWNVPKSFGLSGENRNIYPAEYTIDLYWSMMPASMFSSLFGWFQGSQTTGSYAVDLPVLGDTNSAWATYSGTIFDHPAYADDFETYYEQVKVTLRNVRP